MALPHRRQTQLAKIIYSHDLTRAKVAEAIGASPYRFTNIMNGATYPSPDELDALERLLNNLPAAVMFDEEMLEYRHSWPPPRGFAAKRAQLEAEVDRLRSKAGE